MCVLVKGGLGDVKGSLVVVKGEGEGERDRLGVWD